MNLIIKVYIIFNIDARMLVGWANSHFLLFLQRRQKYVMLEFTQRARCRMDCGAPSSRGGIDVVAPPHGVWVNANLRSFLLICARARFGHVISCIYQQFPVLLTGNVGIRAHNIPSLYAFHRK